MGGGREMLKCTFWQRVAWTTLVLGGSPYQKSAWTTLVLGGSASEKLAWTTLVLGGSASENCHRQFGSSEVAPLINRQGQLGSSEVALSTPPHPFQPLFLESTFQILKRVFHSLSLSTPSTLHLHKNSLACCI